MRWCGRPRARRPGPGTKRSPSGAPDPVVELIRRGGRAVQRQRTKGTSDGRTVLPAAVSVAVGSSPPRRLRSPVAAMVESGDGGRTFGARTVQATVPHHREPLERLGG